MGQLDDPTGEKALIADQLRRGVSASEVMAGVRARAAGQRGQGKTDAMSAIVGAAASIDELEAVATTKPVVHVGKARRVRIENLDPAGRPMTSAQAIASLASVPPPAELEVREVPYEAVAEWKSQAARDHVALGPTGNTTWYAALRGKEIVGVAGLIRVGKVVRVKGVYVPRALRGQGIGTFLTEAVIAAAPAECDVEVLAYNPAFYSGRGFDTQGEFRKGVTRLIFARSRG